MSGCHVAFFVPKLRLPGRAVGGTLGCHAVLRCVWGHPHKAALLRQSSVHRAAQVHPTVAAMAKNTGATVVFSIDNQHHYCCCLQSSLRESACGSRTDTLRCDITEGMRGELLNPG